MKMLLLLLVTILLLQSNMLAQAPDTLWTKTYGGNGSDEGNSVRQTSDGGYIVAGSTQSYFGDYNIYLIKTDSSGDTLWTKTFGGIDREEGSSVQQTSDGGYIVAGTTYIFRASGSADVYLIKTDSSGDTLWTKTFGGNGSDWSSSVQQTNDGGYIVAGHTDSFGAGRDDVYLIKTDSSGDLLWTKTYGGDSSDEGSSVQQTSDGGYIVAGSTMSFGAGEIDLYLIKTDSSGDSIWTKTYGGNNNWGEGNCVKQTNDGGYIVAGTSGFPLFDSDVYLIKTNSTGDTLWTKTFGGNSSDGGHSVQQTKDGGYILTGAIGYDVCLIKTNSSGDTLWTKAFGGNNSDEGSSVQQISDGGYILVGFTYSFGAGNEDDVWLIKLAPESPTAVRSHDDQIPSTISLDQNYPNPFNPSTTIKYQIPANVKGETANVKLFVFDLLGREVVTLVNEEKQAGNYEVTWDASRYSSGVYFYQLKVGEFIETKKLVLLK